MRSAPFLFLALGLTTAAPPALSSAATAGQGATAGSQNDARRGALRERILRQANTPPARQGRAGTAHLAATQGQAPISSVNPLAPQQPVSGSALCAESIRDAADPANCLQASSVPTLGALYPLGLELNVHPSGLVGINTLAPEHALDVVGDVRSSARLALGNDAAFGLNGGYYDAQFDISTRIQDFSSTPYWTPLRSYITVDPEVDLVGVNATYIYSHDLGTAIPQSNTRDVEYLQGPYMFAFHEGSGNVGNLGGALATASSWGGQVEVQGGMTIASIASGSSQVGSNTGLYVVAASWNGSTNSIQDNYGIYIDQPDVDGSLVNNYGLYLGNQDVGSGANYSLYSAGGPNYFAGNVGIGALPSSYALQVGMPGDGSEARANAWNVLSSQEYKRDVEALDAAELQELLEKLLATDVVRYRYTGDDHLHVGVIAEESPSEILSRDGKGVSLGDYAGSLLAGMKAQQAEIEALRAELGELRALVQGATPR